MKVVVDACVLRSASESSVPLPKHCREVLLAVKAGYRTVVACPALLTEWRVHQSIYATKWLSSMFARRRVELVDRYLPGSVGAEISVKRLPEPLRSDGLKDIHLLRVAIDHDGIIVSSELRCRSSFAAAKAGFPPIGGVAFVNPSVGLPLNEFLKGFGPPDPVWNL